ncbi:MAG: nitrate reductase molybdenum cofactor assembly chaperone, partial [Pseudomonadota bacterium]|nr:nitrate reductase molybdenum cofactor assembly chaperone [Pseudomonadota bacterium]
MQILKILSRLMDYPTAVLQENQKELISMIRAAREISPAMREKLVQTLNAIYSEDLMDAQENYTSFFDRGRSLSLLLFEHVHGESRDRGQAMVDLMAQYEAQGFSINVREL